MLNLAEVLLLYRAHTDGNGLRSPKVWGPWHSPRNLAALNGITTAALLL